MKCKSLIERKLCKFQCERQDCKFLFTVVILRQFLDEMSQRMLLFYILSIHLYILAFQRYLDCVPTIFLYLIRIIFVIVVQTVQNMHPYIDHRLQENYCENWPPTVGFSEIRHSTFNLDFG